MASTRAYQALSLNYVLYLMEVSLSLNFFFRGGDLDAEVGEEMRKKRRRA